MNGTIKAYEALGKNQQLVIELLWEAPSFEWTYTLKDGYKVTPTDSDFDETRWGSVNTVLRTLDGLTKYEVISAIPVIDENDEENVENGRVIKTASGFQYETIEGDITVADEPESVEPEQEPEPEVVEKAAPAKESKSAKLPIDIAEQTIADKDAEITALRDQLKAKTEHIEVLRDLINRRDIVIKTAMGHLKTIDTSGSREQK